MFLEAVWLKNGKEVYWVDPVLNIVCDDDINNIAEIEVDNGDDWHSYEDADDFIIRIKKD